MDKPLTEIVMGEQPTVNASNLDPLVKYASNLQHEYEGSSYRQKIIDLAKEAREEYEGFRKEKKIPWEGSANYSMMVSAIITDEMEQKIATLLTGKGQDIVEVSSDDPELDSESIEGFAESVLDKGVKWNKFIPTSVHNVLLDGTVFILPRYEEKTIQRGERMVGIFPLHPVTGQPIASKEDADQIKAMGIKPVEVLVDEILQKPRRVFRVIPEIMGINETYGPDTIKEWGCGHPLIFKRWFELGDLMKMTKDKGGPYINITPDLASEETNQKSVDDISLDADNWQLTAEQERKQIECYECWLPNVSVNEGDDPDWAIVTYTASNKTLIRKQYMRDVYYDNEFPIKRLGLLDDGNHFFCTPLWQKIKHPSKAINDLANQMIDSGTIEINPVFWFDPVTSGISRDDIDWYPGAMNPCSNPDKITQVQTSLKSNILIEFINLFMTYIERLVGVTSYNEGIQDGAMAQGAGTAAGMRMLLSESQGKRNYQTKSMRENLEELIFIILRLYAWYMPYDEQFNIKGKMQPADIKALQSDFSISIRISDSAANDMMSRLETVELFNLAIQLPFSNQVELFKDVLERYQKKNTDRYIKPEFLLVLQAVTQNPEVAQVVQQFMQQQQEQMKIQKMQQSINDAMLQKGMQDVIQADAVLKNSPNGLPDDKIAKAFDSIENSQARDLVEAIINKGVKASVMPPVG